MQSKTFKPGDLARWIGEWPFPLVDAPPRENTVLAIETDGKVRLDGRHGNDALQRWWCPPSQLVHREPVQATTLEVVNDDASLKARFAALAVRLRDAADTYSESPPIFGLFFEAAEALDDAIKVDADLADAFDTNSKIAERIRSIMSTCFDGSRSGDLMFQLADMEKWVPKFTSEWKANHRQWLELCTRLGLDALDLEQRGRVAEVDAVAGEALELKRIRSIVDGDARKRLGDREGEPSCPPSMPQAIQKTSPKLARHRTNLSGFATPPFPTPGSNFSSSSLSCAGRTRQNSAVAKTST